MSYIAHLIQDGSTNPNLRSTSIVVQFYQTVPSLWRGIDIDYSPSAKEKDANLKRQEIILENLLNRDEEEEDIVLFGNPELLTVIERAKNQPASLDWEAELDEL